MVTEDEIQAAFATLVRATTERGSLFSDFQFLREDCVHRGHVLIALGNDYSELVETFVRYCTESGLVPPVGISVRGTKWSRANE